MQTQPNAIRPGLVPGERSLGRLLPSQDWAATPLGAKESWSPALQAITGVLLANRFPMLLWWGPEYIQLYNDAYRPILGTKHPEALGQPAGECWPGIWHIIGPLIETPFRGGPATWLEDLELEIDRYGYLEETHFTVAYSPVPDPTVPGGIGGVLATVLEITQRIIGARRIDALHDLTRAPTGDTALEACAIAARTLAGHDKDLPFGLIYLTDADGQRARLAGSFGAGNGAEAPAPAIELNHPDIAWSNPSGTAVVLPIRSGPEEHPLGLFVGGVSARCPLNNDYRVYLELVAGRLAMRIGSARAREEAQQRVEALAEIARVKARLSTEQALTRKKLQEQTSLLEAAVRRAEDADHRKSDFLATVAHELKNPLVPVLNAIEIMKRADADKPARERARDMIERQVHQMKRLVDDLLDISRISHGEVEFKPIQVNLGGLLERAIEASRPAIEACGQTLTMCPASDLVMVHGDAGRLTQVFANLLTNASKYTERGGRIAVGLERQGSDVLVRVSDTGIGIPTSLLERIFERFVQVAPSVEGGGMGIGLALARQMVELHGGTITAHSRGAGLGSEFTVRLPAETDVLVARAPAADPEPVAPTMTRRVLVVDDNRDAVESLAMLLGLSGYEAETAQDGVEAVRIATAWRPDVVLLDIGLPRMNGYEVCRAIRAELWGRDLPVIALTGRGHDDARRLSADAGFTAHLVKPVDFPNLMKVLAQVGTQAA